MIAFAFYVAYAVVVGVAIVLMAKLFLHLIGPPHENDHARMYVVFSLLLLVMAAVPAYELWQGARHGSMGMFFCKGPGCDDITLTLAATPQVFVMQVVGLTVLMALALAMVVFCVVHVRRIRRIE